MSSIKETIVLIKGDLPHKSLKGILQSFLFNQGFRVLLNFRIGFFFYSSRFLLFRQIGLYYRNRLITKRNCDISYKAKIGKNLRLPHPLGIVIGDGVVVEDNVKIWQQVTLGSHGKRKQDTSYPTVKSGVKIFTGAKIFGAITIGENSIIGANAVVNKDVPSGSTAVGIPCKIILR